MQVLTEFYTNLLSSCKTAPNTSHSSSFCYLHLCLFSPVAGFEQLPDTDSSPEFVLFKKCCQLASPAMMEDCHFFLEAILYSFFPSPPFPTPAPPALAYIQDTTKYIGEIITCSFQ